MPITPENVTDAKDALAYLSARNEYCVVHNYSETYGSKLLVIRDAVAALEKNLAPPASPAMPATPAASAPESSPPASASPVQLDLHPIPHIPNPGSLLIAPEPNQPLSAHDLAPRKRGRHNKNDPKAAPEAETSQPVTRKKKSKEQASK